MSNVIDITEILKVKRQNEEALKSFKRAEEQLKVLEKNGIKASEYVSMMMQRKP